MEELPGTLDLAFAKIRTQLNSGVAAVRRPASLLVAIEGNNFFFATGQDRALTGWERHRDTQEVRHE